KEAGPMTFGHTVRRRGRSGNGGLVVVGIEKEGQITGTRRHADNVQNLLRAAFDYCEPAVKVETRYLDCHNERGEPDQILLMASPPGHPLSAL
ncbi:MAG: RNA-binding domain-containing protein, partial [Anaerolineae bacterium]